MSCTLSDSAAHWWLLYSDDQTHILPLWSEDHLMAFYSDGSACLPRSPCHVTVMQLARPFEQTCPLNILALCQYLQGVSCLCPARHVLGLQQQLTFHSWSRAGHRSVRICDGSSGSDVICSHSGFHLCPKNCFPPQHLLLGLMVDLSASLPWVRLKGSLAHAGSR